MDIRGSSSGDVVDIQYLHGTKSSAGDRAISRSSDAAIPRAACDPWQLSRQLRS